jgi:hypothetical protein
MSKLMVTIPSLTLKQAPGERKQYEDEVLQ